MAIDTYYYKARLFPTVLTSIPILILFNTFVAPLYHDSLKDLFHSLPIITDSILSIAIIFLFTQINRLISKELFQSLLFQEELYMPTTNHLLNKSNFYLPQIREKITQKIATQFNITLMDGDGERQDELQARKLIISAVSQIRILLRDSTLLLQHNIEYGFVRNLIGGSLLALIFSITIFIVAMIQGQSQIATGTVFLILIYSIPILFCKVIIRKYGEYYAKILFEEFLSR